MVMASLKHCARNLIAEQEEFEVKFETDISWRIINEKAVNKLPKFEPCEQYLDRLNRFCEARGLVITKTNKGRGLMARKVNSLGRPIK
jgi:hypothetical protein